MRDLKGYLLGAVGALLCLFGASAHAQSAYSTVVSSCGTPPYTYPAGTARPDTQDTNGYKCTIATFSPSGTQNVSVVGPLGTGTAATGVRVTLSATDAANLAGPIPAGTAIIGKFGIDQTTDGTTNAVHLVAGTAIAGKVGIDQTTDGTTNGVHLVAGTALAGKFGIDQTTPGTTNGVQVVAGTTGGASSYTFEVAASDNHQVVKNGAGTLFTMDGFSIHTAAMFVRLYDAGTGFNGCNSATNLLWEGQLPGPGTTGGGFAKAWGDVGKAFTTGLSVCVTGAFGNTNTTSATANVASVNLGYK